MRAQVDNMRHRIKAIVLDHKPGSAAGGTAAQQHELINVHPASKRYKIQQSRIQGYLKGTTQQNFDRSALAAETELQAAAHSNAVTPMEEQKLYLKKGGGTRKGSKSTRINFLA